MIIRFQDKGDSDAKKRDEQPKGPRLIGWITPPGIKFGSSVVQDFHRLNANSDKRHSLLVQRNRAFLVVILKLVFPYYRLYSIPAR